MPEEMLQQQLSAPGPEEQPQSQPQEEQFDPNSGAMPDSMLPGGELGDPMEFLPEVVNQYLDYAIKLKSDETLNIPVKTQAMLQMAQAINYLVPLVSNTDQQDKQQEFQLKIAEFEMKMKEQENALQLKQQEHQMNMAMKQQELQFKQAESQMKLRQNAEQHQQKLVQSEQAHQTKVKQQEQAAQSKQSNNHGND